MRSNNQPPLRPFPAPGNNRPITILRSQIALGVEPLRRTLESWPGIDQVAIVGGYRRGKAHGRSVVLLAAAVDHELVMAALEASPLVSRVWQPEPRRYLARLVMDLDLEVRVVGPDSFGAALHHHTGSKAHRAEIQLLAQEAGLELDAEGVFRAGIRLAGESEASIYQALGLPFIPPELREGEGEIEAARQGGLPRLIERSDLRGDLHLHTTATDGTASLRAMAEAARHHGLSYIAVTDHSQRLEVVNGLNERRLREQMAEIDRLNQEFGDFRVLKGIEVDILEDGQLDLPDSVLRDLDLVIGSIHYRFGMPEAKQTARVLRAMDNRYFTILGHPGGRLLNERPPLALDMERILHHARDRGCYLELDSQPQRLELEDRYCRLARELGVKISIDSDSHSPQGLAHLDWGVAQARRGWLEPGDVLNTRPLDQLLPLLWAPRG